MGETEVRCGCLKWVRLQIFGSGLSGVIPFRCVRDSTVLALSVYDKGVERVLGSYPHKAWTTEQFRKVESELAPCSCGGAFIHNALPKCPYCGSILRLGGLNPDEVIVVQGKMVDSEKQNVWKTNVA